MRHTNDGPFPTSGRCLLIVDPDTGSALRRDLEQHLEGYVVEAVDDVPAALASAEAARPLLVLVRDRDGLPTRRLCARLRSDWRYGNPLLFVVTDDERSSAALAGLADECLAPSAGAALALRIDHAVRRSTAMRDASPLTGLPGNAAITAELQRRIARGDDVALLYADLDHFKAYNDHYGFLRGDDVIVGLAGVLRSMMAGRRGVFVGHVGGDDFILLAPREGAEDIARCILRRFEQIVGDFYDSDDRARGGVLIEDRRGRRRKHPLVTLSIGVAASAGRSTDHRALVAAATEMKGRAKQSAGHTLAVDRRRAGPAEQPPRVRPRWHWLAAPFAYWDRSASRRFVSAAAVAVLFVTLGLVGFSGSATPGDRLYPVKLAVEDARLLLTVDPAAELELHLEFSSRRVLELIALAGSDGSAELIDLAGRDLRRHLAALEDGATRGGPAVDALRGRFEFALAQQQRLLAAMVAQDCTSPDPARRTACAELGGALAAADRNLDLLRGEHRAVVETPRRTRHDPLAAAPSPATAPARQAERSPDDLTPRSVSEDPQDAPAVRAAAAPTPEPQAPLPAPAAHPSGSERSSQRSEPPAPRERVLPSTEDRPGTPGRAPAASPGSGGDEPAERPQPIPTPRPPASAEPDPEAPAPAAPERDRPAPREPAAPERDRPAPREPAAPERDRPAPREPAAPESDRPALPDGGGERPAGRQGGGDTEEPRRGSEDEQALEPRAPSAKPEAEPAPEPEVAPQPEAAPETEVAPQPEPAPEPEVAPQPEPAPESEGDLQPEPAPESEGDLQPEPAPESEGDLQPEPAPESEAAPGPETAPAPGRGLERRPERERAPAPGEVEAAIGQPPARERQRRRTRGGA